MLWPRCVVDAEEATRRLTGRNIGGRTRRSLIGRRGSAQPENCDAGVRLGQPASPVSAPIVAELHRGQKHRPRPTANRVVYLRCRVRNLVHRHRPEGGWGRYVAAESLDRSAIPGDHGSALHARWKPAFLAILRQALSARS